jgi:hypothetical protein
MPLNVCRSFQCRPAWAGLLLGSSATRTLAPNGISGRSLLEYKFPNHAEFR